MAELKELGLYLGALVLLIISNTIAGAILAGKKAEFDWKTLWAGLLKALGVALAIASFVGAGILVGDNIKIGEQTLFDALKILFLVGGIQYATDALAKFYEIFKIKQVQTTETESIEAKIEKELGE